MSLSPELSRVLIELGVARAIVAADGASRLLPELAQASDLGKLAASDLDVALATGPELAFALGSERAEAFSASLRARGVTVHVFSPRSANEADTTVRRLGALLGREARAQAVRARVTRGVSNFATSRDAKPRHRAVWIVQRDPLQVVGGAGLLHEALELAGAENTFEETPEERSPVTVAQLLARGLDVALDSSAPGGPPLPLPKRIRVVRIPAELARLPALALLTRVRELNAALYAEEPER